MNPALVLGGSGAVCWAAAALLTAPSSRTLGALLGGAAFLGERLTRLQVAGVAVLAAGAAVLAGTS